VFSLLSEGGVVAANQGEFHSFLNQFLSSQLDNGEQYTVEFWSQMHPLNMQASIPPQLMITEDTLWQFDYLRKNLSPLITSNTIFTDTVWRKFSASFVATGNEIQLTIGHFFKPQNTPWVPSPYNPGYFPFTYASGYFIDAVSLFKSSDTLFTADLGPDTLLCPGEALTLQPDVSGFKLQDTVVAYLWSTGSTDSILTVNAPGTYWVEVTFDHRFVGRDTINVSYYADNLTLGLAPVVEKCLEQTIALSATNIPFTTYLWSTGEQGTTIWVSDTGLYFVEAQTPCYGLADSTRVVIKNCNEFVYIPNAFTPNGDGLNDYFEVFGVGDEAELLIYNRWGELIFQAQPYLNNWDATYQGQLVEMGVYLYKIKYPLPGGGFNTLQGTVMVLP
jgi:gliding motility-associated-like protein